jgi:hypothetical protein
MRYYTSLVVLLSSLSIFGQAEDLVDWQFTLSEDGTELEIEATIATDWVIYSQHTDPDGPIPLEFEFTDLSGVELDGAVVELTKPITELSDMFDVTVMKFKKKATFKQKLKLTEGKPNIKGTVTYMSCDATRCLPPKTVPFEVE